MPLVHTRDMLLAARRSGYAVGAFNVENMEMAQAVVAAAQELLAPVIVQTTPGTLRYASPAVFLAQVKALAEAAKVPVAMHLDHGSSITLCGDALQAGYTSVMIDGSAMPLNENIAVTQAVVKLCGDIPVEGELGRVGGKEDDTESDGAGYTDLDEAIRFVRETGVSSLAVGVGTAHGIYAQAPVLNVPLIGLLREHIAIPLVLHGASGLPDDAVRACIENGISKVNFATDLRIAYTEAVKAYLNSHPSVIDPKKYGEAARAAVCALVKDRMRVCGCDGRVNA